jgi:quercetin dioxygenase-like cupin family protein
VLGEAAVAADLDHRQGGTVRAITSTVNPRFNVFDFSGGPRKFYTYYRVPEDLLMIQLAGQLEVEIETTKTLILSVGDTLFVRGGVNHRWRQVGRGKCRMLTVIHAPQGTVANDSALDVLAGQSAPSDTPKTPVTHPTPAPPPQGRKKTAARPARVSEAG